jgi:CSLREA domain-containing protein
MAGGSALLRTICRGALALVAVTSDTSTVVSADTFPVTKTGDTRDGACDADCSLREAIIAANEAPGADTILLPAGTYVRRPWQGVSEPDQDLPDEGVAGAVSGAAQKPSPAPSQRPE